MAKEGQVFPVNDKMVPVTKEDMKVGAVLLIMNDQGDVSEQVFRGKIRSEKKFRVYNPNTDEEEWVNVEPDYSYMEYLETMRFLFKHKRILKYV